MSDRFHDVSIAWRSFAELLTELLTQAPEGVTIDVVDDRFGEDWTWLVEASSTEFTSVPPPPNEDSPNHYQVLGGDDVTLSELAQLMVRLRRHP